MLEARRRQVTLFEEDALIQRRLLHQIASEVTLVDEFKDKVLNPEARDKEEAAQVSEDFYAQKELYKKLVEDFQNQDNSQRDKHLKSCLLKSYDDVLKMSKDKKSTKSILL